jgi:hypothetical protein
MPAQLMAARSVPIELDIVGVAHVGLRECRHVTELGRKLRPGFRVEIDYDHAPPLAHQLANRGLAQAGSSTRHQRY